MAASTLVDYVRLTTLTVGTGPITLGAPVLGFRDVTALTDGATYSYLVTQPTEEFELGRGVFTQNVAGLTRVPLWSSSAGNVAIALTGLAIVAFTLLAEDLSQFISGIPVLNVDPLAGSIPQPYFIQIGGVWMYCVVFPDGSIARVPSS